jgi:ParB-like chromosome segregation protein Spo0J
MEAIKVSVDTLLEFEGNPRKGNVKELVESLKANGQYKPIVVQKSTLRIIAGNHLWKAAKELGWTEIDVVKLDVDDSQAKKIVAADNRLADLGAYDEKLLLDLLGDIDLTGTGYVPADVDDLLAMLEEQSTPEWKVAGAESHQENVQIRPSLAERADRYAERTIRLLMCEYPNHQYVWIIEALTDLRTKYGVDSNAIAILHAVSEVTGLEVPE